MNDFALISSITAQVLTFASIFIIGNKLKRLPFSFRWFGAFLILALIIEIIARILWWNRINNLFLLHFYTLLEFIFLSLFYSQVLTKYTTIQKYKLHFIVGISILIILNTIFLQPLSSPNNNVKTLTQVIYIGYAVAYFFQEASVVKKNALQYLLTLINSAILLYYAGSLFIFMFSSVFPNDLEGNGSHRIFWVVNTLLYLIFQLLVFIALWTFRQRTKST